MIKLFWDNFNEQHTYPDDSIEELNITNEKPSEPLFLHDEDVYENTNVESQDENKDGSDEILLPEKEFDSLPNDVKQVLLKGENLNRKSITSSDGIVYSFPEEYIAGISKSKRRTIKDKKPTKKTHTYVTRSVKKTQSQINFPTVKKLKWQGIP